MSSTSEKLEDEKVVEVTEVKRPFWSRSPKSKPPPADEEKATEDTSSEKDKKKEDVPPPVSFFALFRFSTPFEIFLDVIGIICAIAAGASQPLMTLFFGNIAQSFIDYGVAVQNFNPANATSVQAVEDAKNAFRSDAALDSSYITYIGVGMFVLTLGYMQAWVWTGEVNSKRIREHYLRSVLRQEIAYFDNVGAGEIATRIQTDTHLIQQGISEKVPLSIFFLSTFVTGFIMAYARSWKLSLAMSSILPCIGITGAFMNKFVSTYTRLALNDIAEGGSVAEEVISTIRTAQAFGTQNKLSVLYDVHVEKARGSEMKSATFTGVGLACFFFVIYSAYALAFSFGTTLVLRGEATPAIIINVFVSILIGSFSLALLAPEAAAIVNAQGAAAKIFSTIDRVPSIDSERTDGKKLDNVHGDITFEHVKFNYPSRPDVAVLKDLSIKFPAGKAIALVGASGSGKSTVIQLIERFYDPLGGCVKLDGVDIREMNVRWLRQQIGLVSQEPILFATTIKENVAYGLIGSKWENNSDDEKFKLVKEACVKANADSFISKLPLGYDTLVGERGFLLSGGQKQRVAIARAIVSDPRILLLDEATSALDTQSEVVVQDALDKAAAGRTTITIAHRLSTIKDADCIYVVSEGELVESGTHDELLNMPGGAYARLVHAQKLRESNSSATPDEINKGLESDDEPQDIEKFIKEEVPLGRMNTSHSVASEVLKRQKLEGKFDRFEDKEHGLFYLFKRMGAMQKEVKWKYFIGSFFAVLTGMVFPAFGIVYAKAVTTFETQDRHELRKRGDRNALWFFVIALLSMWTILITNSMFGAAAANLTAKLRSLSFKAILRQDIEFFDQEKNSTGGLTASLSDNPQKISGLAGITLGTIIQAFGTVITGSVIGLAFSWKLALVGIACYPPLISVGYIRLRVVVLKDQVNKKEHADSAQIACEAAAAVRTVASLTRERDCLNNYSKSLEPPLKRAYKSAFFSNAFYSVTQAMAFWVISLVFWYGSILVSAGEIGTTRFFVCLFSTTFGAMQAGNVFQFVPDVSSARGAASDIINLLDSRPEIDSESKSGNVPKNVQGAIKMEDVHFRYPTRPAVRVLRDFNLNVKPGTYIALVGASGCGKSTIIQLLERFYNPLAGKIYLDGQEISDLNVQEYRKHIALVSQEPTLYAGSIKFNILLGATKPSAEVTQDEIEAACKDANILDFIQSLPNGFSTEVGGKGSQLSGGQKQRIAIARALLRNPKVLLLDEATSALDSNSEKIVQEALDQAAKGRTTIAIAHRLSTIQNADCIYFIKDGRVSESGTHDHLLSLRGGYYEYVQLQALNHS